MQTKLVALALIRATVEEDQEALQVILSEHPPSGELVADLTTLAAGTLEQGLGRTRALAAIDGWMQAVLTGSSW